jgi:hypothetical protein
MNMNTIRAPKSEKPKKPRTRPESRRAFTPSVDRLEQRISLSGLSPSGNLGHGIPLGPTLIGGTNHNETLVRARPPRKRNGARREVRRALAPAVEGLERRVSLSGLSLTGGLAHSVGLAQGYGLIGGNNHNETLVRAPRRRRR